MIATTTRPSRTEQAVRRGELRRLRRRVEARQKEAQQCFRPLPAAEAFYASRKPVSIIDGSNQSGKSLHALMMLVYIVTGNSPYPGLPQKDGRAVVVGFDEQHLADPLWRKLSREGEFNIIQDEHAKRWRAVRPDPNNPRQLDPYDLAYKEKWRDAPPLLPPRFIRSISWANAGIAAPRVVELTTGWQITFRSSKGAPPQGRQIHFCLMDEEIDHSDLWLNELIPRMIKEKGKLVWSATPQTGGIALWTQREKADQGSEHVDRYTLLIDDNPHIASADKQFFYDMLTDEQERAVRYFGHYALVGRRIYPIYDPMGIHGCDPFPIPADWCRYCILDPGTQALSTLLVAVDPDERHLWVYDGFRMAKAEQLAWAMEVRRRNLHRQFQSFVIDQQAGKQHPYADSLNVAEQFYLAIDTAGIEPVTLGPLAGFFPGDNDMAARELALRSMMALRGSGPEPNTPTLQVFRGVLPELDSQIKLARTKQGTLDKRDKQSDEGLVQCLEYCASFRPRYYAPPTFLSSADPNTPIAAFHEDQRRRRQRARRTGTSGRRFGPFIEVG